MKMISDRDLCFTSHFTKAITTKLKIDQNISTSFHPQTDGLSEQKNQWVEQYLRMYTTVWQDDWDEWLPIASFVHNQWSSLLSAGGISYWEISSVTFVLP